MCLDWNRIDADVAVLGAPFDMGTQWRAGARFGPRGIREASTLFSFGHAGAYDHEDDALSGRDQVRIVDIGDADIVHTDMASSNANIELAVRKILARRDAGSARRRPLDSRTGDQRIRGQGPIHIVHFDAHLDFVDERHGVRYGHGNPMRRASEMAHVIGMTQIGIRNVSSSNRDGYDAARRAGSDILSVRDVRRLGTEGVLAGIPAGRRYYVTIDIDGFDPPSRPAPARRATAASCITRCSKSSRPRPAQRGNIVGMDLVEVAPAYDPPASRRFSPPNC